MRTPQEVHCRIGVAVDAVATGVLGRLQPRFHIQVIVAAVIFQLELILSVK
jgi:hypothetical protein